MPPIIQAINESIELILWAEGMAGTRHGGVGAGVVPDTGSRAGEQVASSEARRTLCQSGSRSEADAGC